MGMITTVVVNGFPASSGDGGPATEASISGGYVVGFDAEGKLHINEGDIRIRKIDPSGVISTIVGPPAGGQSAPGDAGAWREMRGPWTRTGTCTSAPITRRGS